MPWQHDPETDEWIMVGASTPMAATPTTPTPTTPGPTSEGYIVGDAGVLPVMTPEMAPERAAEGGYRQRNVQTLPDTGTPLAGYENEDRSIVDRWVTAVTARGNEIRETSVGTFEVDRDGRIVSEMPLPYRVN